MDIVYKVVVLVTVFCVSRLASATYGYLERKYGDEFEPAYIRLKCCNNKWKICCRTYPWETTPHYVKVYCRPFVVSQYSDERASKCINSYKLQSAIKENRNQIYKFSRCSPNNKDNSFINRVIEREKTIKLTIKQCCNFDVDTSYYFKDISQYQWRIDNAISQYNHYKSADHQKFDCSQYGSTNSANILLQEAIWTMGLFIQCAKYTTCT